MQRSCSCVERKKSHGRDDANNQDLYAEIGRLKLENDWLKKKL
jgi:hypothetical protein